MKKITSEQAIKNARSSVEMEGLNVDSEMEDLCARILDRKYSLKEYLNEIVQQNHIDHEVEKI